MDLFDTDWSGLTRWHLQVAARIMLFGSTTWVATAPRAEIEAVLDRIDRTWESCLQA